MKKILLSSFAIIAFGFLSQAQFKVGIKAGINRSEQRINVSHGNALFSNDHFKSYSAGVISELRITDHFYLQPQLLYTRRGATVLNSTGAADTKVRINYIDMPVNLVYKIDLPFGKLFGGTGPVFSYAFSGKEVQNGQKRKLYSDVKTWRHEDISLSFTAGIELNNGFFVSVNSQKGLLDVYKPAGIAIKNRSTSVSIGYLIDWKHI